MPENRIYKIEDSGVGAEIILQIDHVMRPLQLSLFPPVLVGLEKTGAGQTKGVDTLFDIPNQKTVSLKRILADGTQDTVLGAINILVFIDINRMIAPLNVSRQIRRFFFGTVPKKINGMLLQIGKIQQSSLRFGFAVSFCEGLGEFEKKADSRTMEAPIGLQRGRPDGCIAHQTAQENEVIK